MQKGSDADGQHSQALDLGKSVLRDLRDVVKPAELGIICVHRDDLHAADVPVHKQVLLGLSVRPLLCYCPQAREHTSWCWLSLPGCTQRLLGGLANCRFSKMLEPPCHPAPPGPAWA